MNPFVKFLSFLMLPVVLGIGCALFALGVVDVAALGGLKQFFTSNLEGSWPIVLGLSLALPIFLSQWVKAWVSLLVYIVFSVVLYFPMRYFFEAEAPCYLLSGLYILLGVAFWVSRRDRLAPAGIEALRIPAPVWIGLVAMLDLVLGYFFGGGTLVHVYMLLIGYVGGIIFSALYSLLFERAPATRQPLSSVAQSHLPHSAAPAPTPSRPAGGKPKISVLDMKMAAVVEEPEEQDKSISTAKIFVENQDG